MRPSGNGDRPARRVETPYGRHESWRRCHRRKPGRNSLFNVGKAHAAERSEVQEQQHNAAHTHRNLATEIDQPIAALLTDLQHRGMLEDTLGIWGGEFGRTPTSEGTGRDHNHYGFTVWMAGGGIKGGTVYGATDEFGFKAVENPTSVHDLHATILHLLGFDHEKLTFRYAGRDFRLTDVHGRVIHDIIV